MIIADVYLSFNAFFSQRVPRASVDVDSLTDVSRAALTVGARYPFCTAGVKNKIQKAYISVVMNKQKETFYCFLSVP